jgi:hypothetical protein
MKTFMQWLTEISAGDYRQLVPGWKGGPKGPFEDPKRMSMDPKFWRDYYFKKAEAEKELKKAKSAYEKAPEDPEAKDRYTQAAASSLWSAMPTVPESKPYGEYQGWSNWDTWAFSLWASNEYDVYQTIMDTIKTPKDLEKFARRNKRRIAKFMDDVDLDLVNWPEALEGFMEE